MFPIKKAVKDQSQTLYFFSDGGIRLQPPAASAAVVVKNKQGQVVDWYSRLLPPLSSSEAEYYGLLEALRMAQRLQPAMAYFHLDNQTVVGQITGHYAVREPRLKPLYAQSVKLVEQLRADKTLREIAFYFIPREYNLLADALAGDALLLAPQKQLWSRLTASGESSGQKPLYTEQTELSRSKRFRFNGTSKTNKS
ncbi:MAG: reverse transcriptase-like protein [Chloroflexota bacterium]|nr:reverse transcriptase-like protein [Chloroflexota bacterium]